MREEIKSENYEEPSAMAKVFLTGANGGLGLEFVKQYAARTEERDGALEFGETVSKT